ncbi:lectin-like domain-containing protein, partial [Leuconostoc mesenteroides]
MKGRFFVLKGNYFGETKTHYKLYKCGKNWAVMAISAFSLGLGMLVTSRPVSADVAATSTSSIAVRAETTSASSSSAVKADSTSENNSSAVNAETTGASSSSAVKADSTSENNSSAVNAETTGAISSSATNADSTSENNSSAVNAETTGAISSSATNADSTSENNSSAVNAETTGAISSSATNTDSTSENNSSAVNAETTSAISSSATKAETTGAISSSATNADSTSENNSSAVNAETTGAISSSATNADSTSASSSSAVKTETTSTSSQKTNRTKRQARSLTTTTTGKALASDEAALTHVDKDNFRKYFSLNGSARYYDKYGIVIITPDHKNQVGNFSLTSKIDMNKSFTLTGQVDLGSNPNGADGIGFAFHSGNTNDVGNAGGNLGIGGLQDAIGFKLDTWFNSYTAPSSDKNGSEISPTDSFGFGWNGDSANAPYGTFVKTSNKEISTANGSKVQWWWARHAPYGTFVNGSKVQRWWAEDTGNPQALSKADIDGNFHNFVVNYDGAARTLTVSYTQASGKVLTWTTTVASSYQAMAMVVSASTGEAKNLQRFKLTSFDFQEAATVNVKYVDTTGHQLAQETVNYPDGAYVNGRYTTKQLIIPNYRFIKMDDGSVTGTKSLDANGTLIQAGDNGTVIYVYKPAYVTAESKTVNETVRYVDQHGHVVAKQHTDSVNFTRTVVV